MNDEPAPTVAGDGSRAAGRPAPVKAQVLATEHWSLLATRNLVWSESFNRATWYVTVLSASMVALALVANSTGFGDEFRVSAMVVLPLLVVIGAATVVRLAQLNSEDVALVVAMNRLRRGYLDLAPELEPYFVTGHTEDVAGIMQTYGARRTGIPAAQHGSSIAQLVGLIVAVLFGALTGLVADAANLRPGVAVTVGALGGLTAMATTITLLVRHVRTTWQARQPGPSPFPMPQRTIPMIDTNSSNTETPDASKENRE